MITKEQREKDKAICEAATRGTWEECGQSIFVAGEKAGEPAAEWVPNVVYPSVWSDRAALANAVNRLPAYIADAEEMERRIAALDNAIEDERTDLRGRYDPGMEPEWARDRLAGLEEARRILRGAT